MPTHAFAYVDCEIPPGMSIAEWKRATSPPRPSRRPSVLRMLRRRARPA